MANITSTLASWISQAGLSSEGRDLSPFLTGAVLVAQSDGPLSDAEIQQLGQLQQGLTGQELAPEALKAERDWIAQNGNDEAVKSIAKNITSATERELLVSVAALIAAGERGVNAQEGAMLQKLGQGLGFSQLQVQQLLGRAMKSLG